MKHFLLLSTIIFCAIRMLNAQVIFNESFETSNTQDEEPYGWFCDDGGWLAASGEQSHGREPHTGNWYANISYGKSHWMFHEIDIESGKMYEFAMWQKTDGASGFKYQVSYGDTLEEPNFMQNSIIPLTSVNNDSYEFIKEQFTSSQTATVFLGIYAEADNTPWYLCVDDISVREVASYEFDITRLNVDTAIVAGQYYDYKVVIENTGSSSDNYQLTSSSIWDATILSSDAGVEISSITIDAFTKDTVIIRQVAPADAVYGYENENTFECTSVGSQTSNQFIFTSIAETVYTDFPLAEGFDNEAFPPMGWKADVVSGSYNFTRSTEGVSPACTPFDNSAGMAFYKSFSAHIGEEATLVTPELDLSTDEYVVRFWFYRTDNIDSKADRLEIYASDDRYLTNDTLLATVHRTIGMSPVETQNGWFEYSYTFPGDGGYKFIVFKAVSDYGWNMYIDHVRIMLDADDVTAPEFISINSLEQYANLEVPVELVVRDDSKVCDTIDGICNVGGVSQNFKIGLSTNTKGNYIYAGAVPAHSDGTVGTVKFILKDTIGNSVETPLFDVSWSGIAPILEESFEDDFPPQGWDIISAPLTWLIWNQESAQVEDDSDGLHHTVTPPDGTKQAVVHWDFQENSQDEWLISPVVEITDSVNLTFETFAQLGSYDYDHFAVKITTNNGLSWTTAWDAFDLEHRLIKYDETIVIPLEDYIGENIRIAWHAYNTVYDNFWYAWYIDDVRIDRKPKWHDITFHVVDNDATNISNAMVSFNDTIVETNIEGLAVFPKVLTHENGIYSVTKTGYYKDYIDTIPVINFDTNIEVVLDNLPTISFEVTDENENAIGEALVSFNDTTIKTNEEGMAVFEKVIPGINYVYSVSKDGNYQVYTDSIPVVDMDTTIAVKLLEFPTVSFVVFNKNENFISEALVTFNDTTIETNEEGVAEFVKVIPGQNFGFSVTKAGDYFEYSDTIPEITKDTVIEVELVDLPKISFVVTDGSENAISQAWVAFNDTTIKTNEEGLAEFANVLPGENYSYSISKTGYYQEYSDTITVAEKDSVVAVSLNDLLSISFIVTDESENTISNALVTFNDSTKETNSDGVAVFDKLLPAKNMVYTVSKIEEFESFTDTLLKFDKDSVINIQLVAIVEPMYTVVFNVTDGNNPMSGVEVSFNSTIESTNTEGVATFADVSPQVDAVYSIAETSEYNEYSGTVTVINQDVVVDVELVLTAIRVNETMSVIIYPNPTNNMIYVEGDFSSDADLVVYNLLGEKVLRIRAESSKTSINLSHLESGIYLLQLIENGDRVIQKIRKQ